MNNILTSIVLVAGLPLQAFGQGSLVFDNIVTGPTPGTSPVSISTAPATFNPADGPPGAYVGADYTASLFWLSGTITNQALFDSLNPIWVKDALFIGTTGPPSGGANGFFDGGTVILPQSGFFVTVQVRAWYNGGGIFTSYEAAKAAGHNVGLSNLLPLIVTAPPGPPSNLIGLLPFTVGIPEPSTFLLAALGGLALLLLRRGK